MRRNNKLLNFIFISLVLTMLINCFEKDNDEYILDLPNYNPTLEEAIGKYYFVPIKNEFYNRDDYKYFNLKKGDTLFLEIKKDSTYTINKFFYNQAKIINNVKGKINIDDGKIVFAPQLEITDAKVYLYGFKKSTKTGLHYYYGINSPTDPTEFEYFLIYKKMK